MKYFVNMFVAIFLFFMLCSNNVFAQDLQDAANTYFSFQEELNQASITEESCLRSTSRVILEGYVVSAYLGLVFSSRDISSGSITNTAVRSISTTLYEDDGFGLYLYGGYRVQVWYEGAYASVITMTVYVN